MADMYGTYFEYGGVSSTPHGLVIANVESTRFTQVAGTIAGVTIFNKSGKRNYLIDDDYSGSPLSFEVDIVNKDGDTLSKTRRREIEKWLFNRHNYRKLYLLVDDECDPDRDVGTEVINGETKRLYMNCRFLNPSYLEYNGGIVGYRVTLETDCGYWWQDAVTYTRNLNHSNSNVVTDFTIKVDTDIDDYTYPRIRIVMGSSGGDVTFINHTDDSSRLTKFTDLAAGATLIIDSEYNYINDQYYLKFYKQFFPRLLDGDNSLSVQGNVQSISITFSNRRNLQ